MGFISSFYRNYFPRKEDYWMPLAQIGLNDYLIWPSFGNLLIYYTANGIA